jgi:hypothetical protein
MVSRLEHGCIRIHGTLSLQGDKYERRTNWASSPVFSSYQDRISCVKFFFLKE